MRQDARMNSEHLPRIFWLYIATVMGGSFFLGYLFALAVT